MPITRILLMLTSCEKRSLRRGGKGRVVNAGWRWEQGKLTVSYGKLRPIKRLIRDRD